jgi:hypothetical protein
VAINLKGAQSAVERLLLVDSCTITTGDVRTGDGHRNYATGAWVPATPVLLYSGLCYVSANSNSVAGVYSVGGQTSEERKYEISIPKDSLADIALNDILTITAIHEDGDPELVGRQFIIEHIAAGTYAVLRKMQCRLFQEVPRDDGG